MATNTGTIGFPAIASEDMGAQRASRTRRLFRFFRRELLGTFGLVLVVVIAGTGLGAELLAPYNPTANDFGAMMEAPSWQHLLGTDQFGRDLLSRIIFGARTAMIVGLSSALIGGTIGLIMGVGSAYFGGKTDLILPRVFDVIMAITIPLIPRCARVVRSSALAIREVPYVDAARALGFGHTRIILCHMVPNVMAPFLIMVTAFVGQAVLAEASLSYLGLGVQEPVPAWGLMLQGGAEEYASSAPWIAIFPGLAIVLSVLGINLF